MGYTTSYYLLHVHGSVDSVLPYRHLVYLDTGFSSTVQELVQAVVLSKSIDTSLFSHRSLLSIYFFQDPLFPASFLLVWVISIDYSHLAVKM